jgi:large subunit ribosomal protein L32e
MSDEFERKDNHCTDRIDSSWRKPKGSDNKQRLGKNGHAKAVDTGYRTARDERDKWNGKTVITVTTTDELDDITSDEAARIPSMGRRKKTPLVQHAVDNDIPIVNLDEEQYLENTEAFLQARKERQEQRQAEAEAKAEAEAANDEDDEAETDEAADDQAEQGSDDEADDEADDDELVNASDAPTSDNTVKEIKAWLDDHSIEYKSSMLKADLLDLVDEHTEDQS